MNSIRKIVIGTVGVAALAFVAGCGTTRRKSIPPLMFLRRAGSGRRAGAADGDHSANHYQQHGERPLEQFN